MITRYRLTERYHPGHPKIIKVEFTDDEFSRAKTINNQELNEETKYFETFEDAKRNLIDDTYPL